MLISLASLMNSTLRITCTVKYRSEIKRIEVVFLFSGLLYRPRLVDDFGSTRQFKKFRPVLYRPSINAVPMYRPIGTHISRTQLKIRRPCTMATRVDELTRVAISDSHLRADANKCTVTVHK